MRFCVTEDDIDGFDRIVMGEQRPELAAREPIECGEGAHRAGSGEVGVVHAASPGAVCCSRTRSWSADSTASSPTTSDAVAGEIGDRAGHAPNAVVAATGQAALFELVAQQIAGAVGDRRLLVELVRPHRRVEVPGSCKCRLAGMHHPSRHDAARLAADGSEEIVGGRQRDGDTAGRIGRAAVRRGGGGSAAVRLQSSCTAPGAPPPHGHGLVAATSRNSAGRSAWRLALATRTRPSSSGWRSPSSTDGGELAQLVEEEHAAMSHGHFARAQRARRRRRPPTPSSWCDAARGRAGGTPIRPRQREARRRVDHRDSEGLVAVERRKDAGQPLGEHRLAGTRRTDEQQVMAACGGDLERLPGHRLTMDVGEIGQIVGRTGWWLGGRIRPGHAVAHDVDELDQGADGMHRASRRHPRLDGAAERHDNVGRTHRSDQRRHAGHRSNSAVEPQFADIAEPLGDVERHLIGDRQDADGDRQIERRAVLALTRRSEIDRDAVLGPGEAAREHGSTDRGRATHGRRHPASR